MRRIAVLVAVGALIPCLAIAQTTGLESAYSMSSFGVFENDLDNVLTVESKRGSLGFRDIDATLLLLGNSNLSFAADTDPATADVFEPATTTSIVRGAVGLPLWSGVYHPRPLPFSLFLGAAGEGAHVNPLDQTDVTASGTPKVVSEDGTTTTYQWVAEEESYEYTANRLTDAVDARIQFLTGFRSLNLGIGARFRKSDSSPQNANYVQTRTSFYDAAPTGSRPGPRVDYTMTEERVDLLRSVEYYLGVPVFLDNATVGHFFLPSFTLSQTVDSDSLMQSYSAPVESSLSAVITEEASTYRSWSTYRMNAAYALMMPVGRESAGEGRLRVEAAGSLAIHRAGNEELQIAQSATWAGGGAPPAFGERTYDKTEYTIQGRPDRRFELSAGYAYQRDLSNGIQFGLRSTVSSSYEANADDFQLDRTATETREDVNANGSFADTVDRIESTAIDYSNTSFDPETGTSGNLVDARIYSTVVSLPSAFTFRPEGWAIGVAAGSEPRATISTSSEIIRTSVNETTSSTTNGDGDPVGNATVAGPFVSQTSTTRNHTVTIEAEHRLGLFVLVGSQARFDIQVDLSTESGNAFNIGNLVVQAIIELP